MISIENFYWALHQNLLDPLEIDARYYYPWGTQNNLSRSEFRPFYRKYHLNHVLFHDQEPFWGNHLGKIYDSECGVEWSRFEFLKILANSEWSNIKKQICKDRHILDWYYFYHGFAALDWYRDAQYINTDHDVVNAFISLNHTITHDRSYRIALLARLINRDIVSRGQTSWHADLNTTMQEIENAHNYLSYRNRVLCCDAFRRCKDLPWRLDNVKIDGNLSAHFGHGEYRLWQRSLLHVVNETVFYQSKLHLTEKIFKPIVAQRPFILVAASGNLAYIRSYGFQTFSSWIDESYDEIQDPDERLDAIAKEISRFAAMSISELNNIRRDMQSVLTFNKQHFFGEFRNLIVNELVDNFDQCIRIWNNGRMDSRELPLHPDLDGVKRILLS